MTDHELTRRDALVALGATGAAAGLGALAWDRLDEDDQLNDHDRATVLAVATAVYPSELDAIEDFVERVVVGRIRQREDYRAGLQDAIRRLDEYVRTFEDADYVDLSASRQVAILSEFGVDVSDPDPDGQDAERVRYYLVNELLYALYTSPTGGELVGLENPQGHPGGLDSYRRPGPEE
jgi:hypothetical protein